MSFKNLCFVVGMLLLLIASTRAGDNTTEKLTRRCKDHERRALMEFKAGVVDEHGILSSWGSNNNNEEECCSWKGIRCSNRTGHVMLLNLPGYSNLDADVYIKLRGKISPSLSELKHLKYLNLSNNWLSGEIPPQLGNLTNLRSLDLWFNYNMKAQNLEWVSHLHLLTHLDLSTVNLSSCNDWLNQIYKLSSLTHLHLHDCGLPHQFGPLNISFSTFNSLVVADLSSNHFIYPNSYNWLFNFTTTLVSLDLSDNWFPRSEIPEAFGRIISLASLFLSRCELQGTLPNSFRNLSRLTTLDLGWNSLNGSLSEFLRPLATKEKNSLQVLSLQQNQIGGSLPDYFTRFPSLRKIDLSFNKLSGSFPYNFGQLSSSLVHLDLSSNQLTGTFPNLTLFSSLEHYSSLVHLDLSYNQLTGPLPDQTLFSSLELYSSLVHLDLSYNQLTGPLPNLTLFSSLETLSLRYNKLEGAVPEAYLSNLSKLIYLDLSSNSLSFNFSFDWFPPFNLDKIIFGNCTLGPHFPNWIKSQHNFSMLDISSARISDTIPLWFWDLSPRLRDLNMSNNQIKGILPNISHTFPDIEWIDLSYNLLQGPIPPLPLRMSRLNLAHNMFAGSHSLICTSPYEHLLYLDLSDNKLSGELPADCFMNDRLYILNLANNDFSGNIPTSIGTGGQLDSLLLRNNSFTGQIPLSLVNNTYLQLLDLSENKLNGEVPTWIGTHLTTLAVLSLRNNEFSGRIPPQICHLRNVQVLDLSQNKLTGSIPHCINSLTYLVEEVDGGYDGFTEEYGSVWKYYPNALVQWKRVASEYKTTLRYLKLIDLSGNRLVGKIPEEFSSLKELLSLNLSSNQLTGNIIPKIGQMANLESLDLSRNHLLGEIPSSLASLTFLSVLDLSNNNLTGKIPLSTQLQSFDASMYAGNEHLWGPPLSNKCGGLISLPTGHDEKGENDEVDDAKFPKFWLYVSVVFGFGTGFWGFLGPLLLQRTWRVAYYKWLGNTADWIRITTMLHMTRLRRKFYD